ncbi:hypothetical protein KSP40_PGU014043 [Platanthera guangdongensis]|uniref:Uncharacterized protein n=1 Tax=Platanthera guangdongensis TaxID=2320717 RepID=A0ABR2MJN8_9ASPA
MPQCLSVRLTTQRRSVPAGTSRRDLVWTGFPAPFENARREREAARRFWRWIAEHQFAVLTGRCLSPHRRASGTECQTDP